MNPQIETEYIPRDDESEAARVGMRSGNYTVLTDEDVKQYSLQDMGLNIGSSYIPDEVASDDVSR